MASSSGIETPAITSPQAAPYNHPYNYSIASSASSSSSSVFSVDAPSSQSSVTPSSVQSLSNAAWGSDNENEGSYPHSLRFSLEGVKDSCLQSICSKSSPKHDVQSEIKLSCEAVALESRQHPRRTQRLYEVNNKNGSSAASYVRPPPALIRQCERKGNFVDSLVDTTTQMIETIWPLSVLSCPRDSSINGRDQTLIGLRTFVQEVLRRSKTSYSTLQVALYYLVLIQSFVPKHDFTMEQLVDSQSCRAMQCGRRMFLAALILASKYLQDRNFSARAWSKISGLRTSEINTNEMAFLSAVNWKLHIPEPVFNRWTDIVLKYSLSSSPPTPSRTSPSPATSAKLWKSVIPYLTPDLDQVDFGAATISNDSSCIPPKNKMASRPLSAIPAYLSSPLLSETNEQTPTNPYRAPKVLEPTPIDHENDLTLPPLPRLGLLPTPAMTPQTGTFSTPAASAFGLCNGRSSMSVAMAQVQSSCLARSTLDNPNYWKPTFPEPFPTSARRSSLALSSSTLSSPESMISDVSSRSSRSSSISSVASICALSRPRLAMQATRRCAKMQLSSLKENHRFVPQTSPSEASICDSLKLSPDSIATSEGDYFTRPGLPLPKSSIQGFYEGTSCNITPTHEAAATLRDLALSHHQVLSYPSNLPNSRKREKPASDDLPSMAHVPDDNHRKTLYPSAKSRKRERQISTDMSTQDCVREMIVPRYLGEIANGQTHNEDDITVLPDPILANSFLMSKENEALDSYSKMKTPPMRDNIARKRACAATISKWDARCLGRLTKERAAPGMWEGII